MTARPRILLLSLLRLSYVASYVLMPFSESYFTGANKKEIAEAIAVATFIAGGSQLGWTNVYSENVMGLSLKRKNLKSRKMKMVDVAGNRTK